MCPAGLQEAVRHPLRKEIRMGEAMQRQVERILDEDRGRVHSVIVQLREPEEELRPILEASGEVLHRRQLVASARDLVPPKAELVRKGEAITSSERRRLRGSPETMTSQVILAGGADVGVGALRREARGAVGRFMRSSAAKGAIQAAGRRSRKPVAESGLPEGFNTFWSSRSVLMKLRTDDLHRLSTDVPDVAAVFPNRTVEVPPIMKVSTLSAAAQEFPASVWGIEWTGALAAWGAYGTRGASAGGPVKVAVLDTGVDDSHPELAGKVVDWAEFDRSGNQVPGSTAHDSGQHGTHVCGTIAGGHSQAPSPDHPWIGMAPDARLAVGLVLKGGSGTYAQILAGMDWAIDSGAQAINMSLGGVSFEPDVLDVYTGAIIRANRLGIPVVVAIGNEGAQTSGAPGNDFFAFSVGATDVFDQAAGFSGGRTLVINESRYISSASLPAIFSKPDISAPGVAVTSCLPGGGYEAWNGTSMAAPHVTGAIALLLAATNTGSVPARSRAYALQELMLGAVEEFGEAGKDHRYGFGRLNVLRAIALAKEQGY